MKQYNRVCARINLDAIAYNMEQMKNSHWSGGTFNSCYQDGCIRTRSSSSCGNV